VVYYKVIALRTCIASTSVVVKGSHVDIHGSSQAGSLASKLEVEALLSTLHIKADILTILAERKRSYSMLEPHCFSDRGLFSGRVQVRQLGQVRHQNFFGAPSQKAIPSTKPSEEAP
jgi:hypothetical protein